MSDDRRHPCPGGCGMRVPRTMYACRTCWAALPRPLQRAITNAYNRRDPVAHRAAMAAAGRWYRARREGTTP